MSQRSSSGFRLSSPLLRLAAVITLTLLHHSLAAAAAAAAASSTPTARGFATTALSPDQGDELKLPWRIESEIRLSTVRRKGGGGRGGVGGGGGGRGGGKGTGQREEGGGGGSHSRRNGAVLSCDRPSGQLLALVVLVSVFALFF